MGKLVSFPQERIIRHYPNTLDLEEARKKGIQHFANSVIDEIVEQNFGFLENQGFDTNTPEFSRDFSFAVDCFRAVIYRSLKLNHPLHEFIDTNITITDTEGNEIKIEQKTQNDKDIEN